MTTVNWSGGGGASGVCVLGEGAIEAHNLFTVTFA